MLEHIQGLLNFGQNPRFDKIVRIQRKINDLAPETRLGVLFKRKWGRIKATISYQSEDGIVALMEFDLDAAYWYVQGIADGMCNLSRRKSLN